MNKNDEKCFLWALLSALHPAKRNANWCPQYRPFQNEVNLEGVEFPVKLDNKVFKRIRDQNPNLYFNVFVYHTLESGGGTEEILPFSLHSDPNAEKTWWTFCILVSNQMDITSGLNRSPDFYILSAIIILNASFANDVSEISTQENLGCDIQDCNTRL